MKINKIKLENPNNGLSNIEMIKLDKVVCIAGPNGSGKSRLLKSIKDILKTKTTTSQLENINTQKAQYNKNIEDLTNSIVINEDNIKNLDISDSNFEQMESELNANISNWQKHINMNIESLKSENLKIKGNEIDVGDTLESYKYIDFVPLSNKLKPYEDVLEREKKSYLENIVKGDFQDLEKLNEQVFSIIYQIYKDYAFTNTSPTSAVKDKEFYKKRWEDLVKYIELFLDAKLTFESEPLLFGLPLNGEFLSKGQSILLQFCVILSLQDTKLDELIIFMDEPENHLHPDVLIRIIELIKNIIPNGQLWIATHSIHILSNVESDSIWYMQNGEIHHHRKKTTELLESLIGKNDEIKKLLNYLSLPSHIANNKFYI